MNRMPVCREGEFAPFRCPVISDVFDIAQRIKEVDPRYFIMFNTTDQKYEIHVHGQPDTTFGCSLPFDKLDPRALEYARKYSRARFEETVREMEERNARLVEGCEKHLTDKANDKLREALLYDEHHPFHQISGGGMPKELINE